MPATSRRPPDRARAARSAPRRPQPSPVPRPSSVLLRFVSCGTLSIGSGLLWRLTLAPQRLGIGSTLLGAVFLLLGFVVGGIGWYLRDARLRMRDAAAMPDERIIFSFVVFALVPFMVLAFVLLIWLVALVVGTS